MFNLPDHTILMRKGKFMVLAMLLTVQAVGQVKQMVQVKAFDQQLKPIQNLGLLLNGRIEVTTNSNGSAFLEIDEVDLPITTIEIRSEKLEIASWNFSKGVVETIVREKNYQIASVAIADTQGQPIARRDVVFTGLRKITARSDDEGKVQIPLPLGERILSPGQFAVAGFQPISLSNENGTYSLIVERVKVPVVEKPQPMVTTKRSYEKEVDSLDRISSLSGFYQIVRDMPMDALTEGQKDRVDAKFSKLLESLSVLGGEEQAPEFETTDSLQGADDIRRLIVQATDEGSQLQAQRDEFDQRIQSLNTRLSSGIADMDPAMRDRLLNNIISLEQLLSENEKQFISNQSEYQEVINSLKERYFDIQVLEGKLSESELLRLQEQNEFRQRLILAIIIVSIFIVLLILLARYNRKTRKQKKELEAANNLITQINEDLEGRVARRTAMLQEANRELDTFLYRASHDLRTPIASIFGICNLSAHITQQEMMEKVLKSTEKMDRLLKNLSVISEINHPAEQNEFCMNEVIEKIKGKFEKEISHNGVATQWICADSIQIKSYALFLEVVMTKLIENALFFGLLRNAPVVKVTTTVSNSNGQVVIVVEDNGVGIDESVRPRIFEMFFKGHEKSKGSGLGLYIVSRCLRIMKGTIEVDSKMDDYARFTMRLPLMIS